jgi:hypothetical protein
LNDITRSGVAELLAAAPPAFVSGPRGDWALWQALVSESQNAAITGEQREKRSGIRVDGEDGGSCNLLRRWNGTPD